MLIVAAFAAAVLVAATIGVAAGRSSELWTPPPISSSIIIERPSPNVVMAVRDLARLETTTFHIERVVDLRDKQTRLFGLIESEDAILLVAAARVTAGVDLSELDPSSVEADPEAGVARLTLPEPKVFHAALDNERTYVHSRSTDLLARRERELESQARRAAERTVREAALEAGILERACESAERTVTSFVRTLGYSDVVVTCTPPGG